MEEKKQEEKKFNFTDNRLKKIKNESGIWRYYYDSNCKGLTLALSPRGAKSFRFHSWDKLRKKTVTISLGTYPDITIGTAREKAIDYIQKIALGVDIKATLNDIKDEATLDDLFRIWLEDHAKENVGRWKEEVRRYELYIKPHFGKKKASSITQSLIVLWRNKLLKQKKVCGVGYLSKGAVQRVFTVLSSIYGFAAPKRPNPCSDVKGYKMIKRSVFFKTDHLQIFFKALYEPYTPEYLKDYLLLSLHTGARRSNVLAMRWSAIDLDLKIWVIPGGEMKNDAPQVVPLYKEVEILRRRKKNSSSIFVFPSKKSKTGHRVDPKRAWKKFLSNAGLPVSYRLHDLRRTLGSWQAMTGSSTKLIGATLGHKSDQATSHYAHLTIDPIRAAKQKAIDAMEAVKDLPDKVVNIKRD